MKKISCSSRNKKIACTISAAALMLGVSSAATIGLHFQENYCGAPAYSGYPVTLTAFGIESNSWENLLEMDTGYGSCSITNPPYGYTFTEAIDSTTSTNGLNPLPNGALSVTWWGPTANYTPFAGYAGSAPNYYGVGGGTQANDDRTNAGSGEQQIYATFIRDGINFGPPGGADNDQPGYTVDITGLKTLFTNTPFVVEIMASSDSLQLLTNVFVIDVAGKTTNSVTYPRIPPVVDNGDGHNSDSSETWVRGAGGGLSTGTGAINADHILITSAQPAHGGNKSDGTDYNHAGTISGFIITDKPVVSMYPQSIPVAGPGDSINLNPYVIGVPPLSFQWRWNGTAIPGATNMSYSIPTVTLGVGGAYDLVASNAYGMATSKVSTVTVDQLTQVAASNIVFDSNPFSVQHNGVNMGAAWESSISDGTTTRNGVMSFTAADSNGVTVADAPALDGMTGSVTFWMQSSGTDQTAPGGSGASLFCRVIGNANDFILYQSDGSPGNLTFVGPTASGNSFTSTKGVSDNKWHFVALTYDQSAAGSVSLYIDGVLDSTVVNSAAWSWTTGQPFEIGYTTDPTYREYNGALSDVRYYNVVLNSSVVTSLFNNVADENDLTMDLSFLTPPQNGFILNWLEKSAILQTSGTVNSQYLDAPAATAPYLLVPAASQEFFRYKYTPQALVSNPFQM